jgi:DNA-directed RNA polymerase specialized sigma24 family protein
MLKIALIHDGRMGMATEERGSVTRWIGELKAGDRDAAQFLWDRYFQRLAVLARARLRAMRVGTADADEEDAALSAFDSFCAGVERGRFPQLSDRDDLWKLLVTMTKRKAIDQAQRQQRQKRGGGRRYNEADLAGTADGYPEMTIEQLAGDEPTPEFAALVAEEYRYRLEALQDETLRRVANWKLEGYTNEEIAAQLGCALRTVANKLKLIRLKWEQG